MANDYSPKKSSIDIKNILDGLPQEYKNSKIYLLCDIFVDNLSAFRNKIVSTFKSVDEIKDLFLYVHKYYLEHNEYPDVSFSISSDFYRSIIIIPENSLTHSDYNLLLEATKKFDSYILLV